MFTDPVKNLKTLGLREDSIVADLAAGTGYYSIAAGHIVTKGKVYAVDIVKDFLNTIQNKAKDANLKNIHIVWGNVEKKGGTQIGGSIIDVVIASNILFQVEDRSGFIEETKRILKPKGRVLLIDWTPEAGGISPKTSIAKENALALFTEKGFIKDREIDAGAHHYGMILVKQ